MFSLHLKQLSLFQTYKGKSISIIFLVSVILRYAIVLILSCLTAFDTFSELWIFTSTCANISAFSISLIAIFPFWFNTGISYFLFIPVIILIIPQISDNCVSLPIVLHNFFLFWSFWLNRSFTPCNALSIVGYWVVFISIVLSLDVELFLLRNKKPLIKSDVIVVRGVIPVQSEGERTPLDFCSKLILKAASERQKIA